MRELTIAIALICQEDDYLLQLRGTDPQIGGAGLIGCFGGKIEPNETAQQAIRKEIDEETTHLPAEDDMVALGSVEVISDHKLEMVKVHAEVFNYTAAPEAIIEASEGTLVRLPRSEIRDRLQDMTTGTRAAFKQFVLEGE